MKLRSQKSSELDVNEEWNASDNASKKMETNEIEGEEEQVYKCPQCPKQYGLKSNLNRHTKIHNLIKCEVCEEMITPTKLEYKRHMRSHTGEPLYQCPTCKKWFGQLHHLKEHKHTHLKEKTFKCPECPNKWFRSAHQRHKHMVVHKKEKRHGCSHCHMRFHRSGELKIHQLIHTNEKPFECHICEKSFKKCEHLKMHLISSHDGVKPHKCQICGDAFVRKPNFDRHKKNCAARIAKRQHKCPHCPKRYANNNSVTRHMKIHEVKMKKTTCKQSIKLFVDHLIAQSQAK